MVTSLTLHHDAQSRTLVFEADQ